MIDQVPVLYPILPGLMSSLSLTAAAISTPGCRQTNEDTILHHISQTLTGQPLGLFIVCDGMGGPDAGDVASKMAVWTVCLELAPILAAASETKTDTLNGHIQQAIATANRQIWQQQTPIDEQGSRRMRTTITLALVVGQRLYVTNVGNSRAYLWRDGQLKQLTRDHSLVTDLADHVSMTRDEMAVHPYRRVLTRSLGRREAVQMDQLVDTLYPGDRLLLCTDGVWQAFAEQRELNQHMARLLPPEEQCQRLIAAAEHLDNADNLSVIVVHCDTPCHQTQLPSAFAQNWMAENSPSGS